LKGLALAVLLLAGCAGPRASLPAVPSNIKKVALRTVVNQTQQFGMEDTLMRNIRDEFLKDGTISLVPEDKSDGVVVPAITRYIVTPVQYDQNLLPTAYKLDIEADLKFLSRATGEILWEEKSMEVFEIYPAPQLPGGKEETAAQSDLWDQLARDIVTRVVQGFGGRGSH